MEFTFEKLIPEGLILVGSSTFVDNRGSFSEIYRKKEFAIHGIPGDFVQENHSISTYGILRGLHFQKPPHTQGKLVRILDGKMWDVVVDMRRSSPTFGKWKGHMMTGEQAEMLWIPPGFAHGFLALSESVSVFYKCTSEYDEESSTGICWDDPDLGIGWPTKNVLVSSRDSVLPLLKDSFVFD